ncbi:MAG: hypothetical protein IJR20_01210 [Muribaculaceae bacterium]|nr:hypothetical protein [Muribaculaceae bacterium]
MRVLPMTCRNSAALRVRQSSGRVALNLVVWTLRSRTAESYTNAGVRPVAITTPESPSSTSGIAMAVDTCCRCGFLRRGRSINSDMLVCFLGHLWLLAGIFGLICLSRSPLLPLLI